MTKLSPIQWSNAKARLGLGTILINSSRGEVVDNIALKNFIKSGKLESVVLDVWEMTWDWYRTYETAWYCNATPLQAIRQMEKQMVHQCL